MRKLLNDLRYEYHDLLQNEYNVMHEWDVKTDPNVPQEFKSDEWWKKRGL